MDTELKLIRDGIMNGDTEVVSQNVSAALEKGVLPKTILDESLISAMEEVGALFEKGEFYVPEMLIAARAMKAGLAILKPKLQQTNIQAVGKVVIGTVSGDLHDIGKNLVAIMLEGSGFEILDLGVDISGEKFVEAIKTKNVDIVALSALLTTTMMNMEGIIKTIETSGLRNKVKIIVGGAPVTKEYAESIGADGFAIDAGAAVSVAKALLK